MKRKTGKNVVFLTLICPCIANIFPNYNQQDGKFLDLFISTDTLHVSCGSSAHHHEHITVHTVSGIDNLNDRVKLIASPEIHLTLSRELTIPEAVCTIMCSS